MTIALHGSDRIALTSEAALHGSGSIASSRGRGKASAVAQPNRQRSTGSARGFLQVNRMQAATETSKNTIESPSGLDFIREIEMWCSLCLVFGTVNVIHRIIDFAETKSVR